MCVMEGVMNVEYPKEIEGVGRVLIRVVPNPFLILKSIVMWKPGG